MKKTYSKLVRSAQMAPRHPFSIFHFPFSILLLLFAACTDESILFDETDESGLPAYALTLLPSIYEEDASTGAVTRGKDDDDSSIVKGDEVNAITALHENYIGSMDIFVKESDAADDAAWFREYHLTATELAAMYKADETGVLADGAEHLLHESWHTAGYDPDKTYDIYVTANNPRTAAGSGQKPANLAALLALDTGVDVATPRYYKATETEPEQSQSYTRSKTFLMDGCIKGWRIKDEDGMHQQFDVKLRRAAAKIVVRVKFSESLTVTLTEEDVDNANDLGNTGYTVGKEVSIKEYLDKVLGREPGLPRWKYVNFGLRAADVADGTYAIDLKNDEGKGKALQTFESNWNAEKADDSGNVANLDNTFVITTYSYPVDWSGWEGLEERTPYILLSFAYTDKNDNTKYDVYYYRIPVCNEAEVQKLERNNIYIVDAEIGSMGSLNSPLELNDEQLRIEYHVIPWTEHNFSQQATTEVNIKATKYLTVTPTTYTLKGDGTQAVDLQWYASVSTDDGEFVDIDLSTLSVSYVNYLGNNTTITGTTTKTANPDGTQDIVISSTAPKDDNADGETTTITITTKGKIKVESDALASRAVKTINFRVKLNNTGLYEDVTIKHFPLDNIQQIPGKWSSRWNEGYISGTFREYSFNPSADGWAAYDGYENNVECTLEEYNHASDGKSTNTITGTRTTTREAFLNNVTTNSERAAANSEANAVNGYWGTGATYVGSTNQELNLATASDNWDYWNYYYNYRGYKYASYFTNASVTTYYARRYYRDVQKEVPSTGNWVDWEKKTGTTVNQGIYYAKIYDGGYCKYINYNNGNYSVGSIVGSTLTNNHMYVVQITATSASYAIGKPTLDGNYQSKDHVVSPAFMIASQLGAVTTTGSGTTAATHCGTYMEVGTDGTRYAEWRLPTAEEIKVIIDYQNGEYTKNRTMVEVLGGQYYWTLAGTTAYVSTGSQGTSTNAYVRCIRDLTLEELNKLNGN